MNHTWGVHGAGLSVGPWPKAPSGIHLSAEPWDVLFLGSRLSRGAAVLPLRPAFQPLATFWGSEGAWEERGIFHHPALVFNLEHWGTSDQKESVSGSTASDRDSLRCPVLRPEVPPGLWLMTFIHRVSHQSCLRRKSSSKPGLWTTPCS